MNELNHDGAITRLVEQAQKDAAKMRTFESGATRSTDAGKLQYAQYLSARVIRRYAEYLQKHSVQADGEIRPGDNWKQGIPKQSYMDSMYRHFMELWEEFERTGRFNQELACALLFNVMGALYEETRENEKTSLSDTPFPPN